MNIRMKTNTQTQKHARTSTRTSTNTRTYTRTHANTARTASAFCFPFCFRNTRVRTVFCALICMCTLALTLCGCASSENTSASEQNQSTRVSLGNLKLEIYDQEIVVNTDKKDCLALYMHVTNYGTSEESVMGSYNVSRNQGAETHLKVAVAYDTSGNALHTGEKRIAPGETADITLCFVLVNTNPVTITFGNEKRGVKETTLTFPINTESD